MALTNFCDSDSTCFSSAEAKRIDQAIQNAITKEGRYALFVVSKDKEIEAAKTHASKSDSLYSECELRAAMCDSIHYQERTSNMALTMKVQRLTPWATGGKVGAAIVLLGVVLGTIRLIYP